MIKFLDLKKQYESIKENIDQAIQKVITEAAFVGGTHLERFETDFANYQQAKFCIGVANGTDAIEIALEALDIEKGSEIIVPANTFIASSEAVTRSGFKVVFCDCDENNYTISINSLRSKITKATKAVIAVHLYGHPCDMDQILGLAREHGLKVIEDCAQAHGTEYKNRRVGAMGDIGTFSFYPGKNLGAYGDGGAIVTNDESLFRRCKMIANHGRLAKYDHEFEGRNSRLDSLQAAILSVKLEFLDKWTDARISVADFYLKNLAGLKGIILPRKELWAKQTYHLFVIRAAKRDELRAYLEKNGVQTGIHYPIALPKLKAYAYLGQSDEDFFANRYDSNLLSLPMGEHLSNSDIEEVCNTIKRFCDEYSFFD